MSRDLKRLARVYRRAGWRIAYTGGGHLRWTSPSGAIVFSASTPSCCFAIRRVVAELRRAERRATALV